MSSIIIFIFAFAGLYISVYFTGIIYRWFSPHVYWVPKVCQMKEKTCMSVLDTPRAKFFGIPNSVFGIGVYSYLILDAVSGFEPLAGTILLFLSAARSIYLAYSLVFVTRIPCPLCFTSH